MDQSLRDFVSEAEDILDNLEESISLLMDLSPDDHRKPDIINAFFRHAHSLKGLSGMLNLTNLSGLAHHFESLLDSIRLDKIPLNEGVIEVLSGGVQLIVKMVRSVASGESDAAVDVTFFIEELENLESGGVPSHDEDLSVYLNVPEGITSVLSEYEEHRFRDNIRKKVPFYSVECSFPIETFDVQLKEITELIKEGGELLTTLPQTDSGGDSSSIGFFLYFTSRDEESAVINSFMDIGLDLVTVEYRTSPEAAPKPEVGASALSVSIMEDGGSDVLEEEVRGVSNTVRVDIQKLDYLMNLVGELVILRSGLAGIAERTGTGSETEISSLVLEIEKSSVLIERKLVDLRDAVMDIRMVPMGQLFNRLQRVSKKIARETGKNIRIEFHGGETELDKMIMEEMVSPLLHIVRNSIDHGIESAEDREAKRKNPEGLIRLSAYQQGSHVVLEVEDDGRGIDLAQVMNIARERGLVQGDEVLSEDEILSFLFLPGFSTKVTVSEVSGRGVGMDIVKRELEEIGGTVEVNTTLDVGTRMVLTLPITLAILQALMIKSSENLYAIPMGAVKETLQIPRKQIKTIEGREIITLRDTMIPLFSLEKIFDLPVQDVESSEPYIVIIGIGTRAMGILVDDLLGNQDVVIKPLGEAFEGIEGLAGAAELGDQSTVLVLDVGGLMMEAVRLGALDRKV